MFPWWDGEASTRLTEDNPPLEGPSEVIGENSLRFVLRRNCDSVIDNLLCFLMRGRSIWWRRWSECSNPLSLLPWWYDTNGKEVLRTVADTTFSDVTSQLSFLLYRYRGEIVTSALWLTHFGSHRSFPGMSPMIRDGLLGLLMDEAIFCWRAWWQAVFFLCSLLPSGLWCLHRCDHLKHFEEFNVVHGTT